MRLQLFIIFPTLIGSLVFAGTTPQTPNTSPATPPPFDADLFRKEAQGFSFHGDFLYWSAQEGALDYAIKMDQNAWGPEYCYAQGKYKSATFSLDPGFRVSASFFRAPKYWEIWGQYTRLTVQGNNESYAPEGNDEFLTGTWPQIFTNPLTQATSHISMNYNVADFWFDRVFLPNPHLRMRFLGGGVMAWLNQFWKVLYTDAQNQQTKLSNRWKFTGGGLRMGVLIDWYWFENIYMTAGTTFATLLGTYRNISKQWVNFSPSPGKYNPTVPIRDGNFKDVRPAFSGQFYLGPSYQKNFPHNRMELFAGYELNAWLNLQESFRSTSGSPSDPKETRINTAMIALQGLTMRATLDF
ncbi:MAG: hypothetical protein HY324_00185 [Chlamydiia bacterium]|nr:hypothetical protein [Chlamydiia bacterium]